MISPNHDPRAEQANMMEQDVYSWDARMNALMSEGAHIIAFRGAGSINGIDANEAKQMSDVITSYITELGKDGAPIALLYDGDEDNRAKPDVGSLFGSIIDNLQNMPDRDKSNVTAIAAQTKSWYYPKTEGGVLESATGNPYETYVFSDDLPGSHARLTQSEDLVAYPNYEQIIVGPAGKIAEDQLKDLSNKAVGGRPHAAAPVKVLVFKGHNNAKLTPELEQKHAAAPNEAERQKIAAKIKQRTEKPYGVLFDETGKFNVDHSEYPGVELNVFEYDTPTKSDFYINRFAGEKNPRLLEAQARGRAEYQQNAAELAALVDKHFAEQTDKVVTDPDGTQHLKMYIAWRSSGSRRPSLATIEMTRKTDENGNLVTDFGFSAKDAWSNTARAVTTPNGMTRTYDVLHDKDGNVVVKPETSLKAKTWKENLQKAFPDQLSMARRASMRMLGNLALPRRIRP